MALPQGYQLETWVKAESAFDTATAFVATDAFYANEFKLDPELKVNKSKEHTGSASLENHFEGKRGGKWSTKCYVKPNAAGTAPDIGEILKAGFGTETVSGGTSVTYSFNDNDPTSIQMAMKAGDGLYQSAFGAWVEQLDFEITGGQEPEFSGSGGFASFGWAYSGTCGATHGSGVSTVTLGAGQAGRFGVGGRVKFASDTNGGAGYLITAVNNSAPSITISPSLVTGVTNGDAITPVSLSKTVGGTVAGGIACDLSIDGSSFGLISAKISIKTGIHGLDKEATTNRASRIAKAMREISGELQVYFIDTNHGIHLGRAWDMTTRNLVIRAGPNTAAQRMKINLPKSLLMVSPVELPDAEEATVTIKFESRKNAAAADECTVVFD